MLGRFPDYQSRHKLPHALGPIGLQQPEHVTPLEPQQLRRRLRRQPFPIQIAQHFQPRDSSPSLISRTVTPNTPRKSPGQCHL
jgi:hypothetical protein